MMAAEDDNTMVEMGEGAPEPAPKKGGKGLLFAGIGVGAVVILAVLFLFVIKPMMAGDGKEAGASTEHVEKEDSHGKKKSGHGGEGSVMYAIKDIVVNPAGTGGARFLSVSFGFELGSPTLAAEIEGREPLVRDALITILSSKTVTQLTDAKQKEIMRYQIKKRLSKILQTEDLEAVYYTDFVLQ